MTRVITLLLRDDSNKIFNIIKLEQASPRKFHIELIELVSHNNIGGF